MGTTPKLRRTDDPEVDYMEADAVMLWTTGIVGFRINRQDRISILTPVMRDRSEGPSVDLTEMHDQFLREQP